MIVYCNVCGNSEKFEIDLNGKMYCSNCGSYDIKKLNREE